VPRSAAGLGALALLIAACVAGTPATPTPHSLPGETPQPTATPLPAFTPTPTSLAEGVPIRLGTPDPSPNCPDHYPWFFDNPAQECAQIVLNVWGVLQPFERGLMVWLQEGGRTYILLEDGSPFKPYVEAVDHGDTPFLEADPAIQPPAGMYQPELGFAKFWRGLVPGYEWVRERLGWATAPESGYSAFWQCNTAADETARCYFTGPRDEIFAMTRNGGQWWTYAQRAGR
jgi:hypothetical protein